MSDVYQVAAPFQVILLRQRVKELEAEIEQLSSVSLADECEEWKKSLAEARAEGALDMWKNCCLALDSLQFHEGAAPGGVWAECSRAIQDLKP